MMSFFPDLLLLICAIVGLIFRWHADTRHFLKSNSGAIGVVIAVIGGAYVLKEHEIAEHNDRLDRTRSYIERIESGEVHRSRQWLDLHWIKNRELIAQIDEANYGENADRGTAKALLEDYGKDFKENDQNNVENIQHIMRLFYFYADLAKCVELGLCDTATACKLFSDDIGKFYVLHSDFITKWRDVSFEQNFDSIKWFTNLKCKDDNGG